MRRLTVLVILLLASIPVIAARLPRTVIPKHYGITIADQVPLRVASPKPTHQVP